jgi:GTP-binding protein
MELKLIADVGLLGFPNAGKSTLISRISAAKPRVADYPFTTLVPSLGVVQLDLGQSFVVADTPGLVEGAADGVGLGHRFLRHIERCPTFAHLISANPYEEIDPVARFHAIQGELERYDATLAKRPQYVLLTQVDLVDDDRIAELISALQEASGQVVHPISSATGTGLIDLKHRLWHSVDARRQDEADASERTD